jgi:hypothetical protein
MSYLAYEELEESSVTMVRSWRPDPSTFADLAVASIPNRSVRFQDPIQMTVRFEKDSAPTDLSFRPSFQVPCDTVFPSSSIYKETKEVTLIR